VDYPNTLELFSNLKSNLEANQLVDQEEDDLVLRLSPIYLEKIQAAEQRGESRLIVKQLERYFGELSDEIRERLARLSMDQTKTLGRELLDFSEIAQLASWLKQNI
jgi:heme oxygenase